MATGAVRGQLLFANHSGMTQVAVELCVCSLERKCFVIVGGDPPGLIAMACIARGSHPAQMTVVCLVAAVASLGDGLVHIAATMTITATQVGVAAEEGEARFPIVIELAGVPIGGGVAIATGAPLTALMNVIRGMTAGAVLRHPLVVLTGVTGAAGGFLVLVGERKSGAVVIEVCLWPGLRVVTGTAVRTQGAPVRVIFLMAGDTGGGGLAIGCIGMMTTAAHQCAVCTQQRKIRLIVREARRVELSDVGIAAVMLGVTAVAFALARLRHAAVVTGFSMDVLGHILVTIQAQGGLSGAIGAVVAGRAIIFQLRVRLRDRPRHDQSFETGAAGSVTG